MAAFAKILVLIAVLHLCNGQRRFDHTLYLFGIVQMNDLPRQLAVSNAIYHNAVRFDAVRLVCVKRPRFVRTLPVMVSQALVLTAPDFWR